MIQDTIAYTEDDVASEPKELTPLQRIQRLDEERATILEEAKEEALSAAKQAIADLNALGFNYTLSTGSERTTKTTGATKKREVTDAPCPICDFKTSPPHDRRTHRTQEPKTPFTKDELEALGLKRID